MRAIMMILIAAVASPAVAAPAQPAPPPPSSSIAIPPQLSDPAMVQRLGQVAGALTRAVMDLPVGQIQAAIEGRPATPSDARRTVRDMAGRDDPNLDRRVEQEVARSGATVQAATGAMVSALPSILQTLRQAEAQIEQATANLPRPDYPRR